MIGVLMTFEALIISLIRGTPSVICNHHSQGHSLYKFYSYICTLLRAGSLTTGT